MLLLIKLLCEWILLMEDCTIVYINLCFFSNCKQFSSTASMKPFDSNPFLLNCVSTTTFAIVYVLQESKLDQEWNVRACPTALTSTNPIRELLESLSVLASKKKEKISLAQGDPTAFGHLKVPDAAVEAMVVATKSYLYNGYTHSAGSHECRKYALIFPFFHSPFHLMHFMVCIS